jgi:hypothetical protein
VIGEVDHWWWLGWPSSEPSMIRATVAPPASTPTPTAGISCYCLESRAFESRNLPRPKSIRSSKTSTRPGRSCPASAGIAVRHSALTHNPVREARPVERAQHKQLTDWLVDLLADHRMRIARLHGVTSEELTGWGSQQPWRATRSGQYAPGLASLPHASQPGRLIHALHPATHRRHVADRQTART